MADFLSAQWGYAQWGLSPWADFQFTGIQPLATSISDTIALSDFAATFIFVNISTFVADRLEFFDLLNYNLSPIQAFFTEMLFIQDDNGSKTTRPDMTLGDSVNLADSVTSILTLASQFSDTLVLTDAVNEIQALMNTFNDTLNLSDAVNNQLNAHLTTVLVDVIVLSDAVNPNLTETLNTYLRRYLNDVL